MLPRLVDAGADANLRSHPDLETPLVKAARYGHGACVDALLASKARLDVDARGADGAPPLVLAAKVGDADVLEALLARAADAAATDADGNSALWHATRNGHLQCMHRLAMAGALRGRAVSPRAAQTGPPASAAAVEDHWNAPQQSDGLVDRFFYKLSFPMAQQTAPQKPRAPEEPRRPPPPPPSSDLD